MKRPCKFAISCSVSIVAKRGGALFYSYYLHIIHKENWWFHENGGWGRGMATARVEVPS